jgi:hypothetical protein
MELDKFLAIMDSSRPSRSLEEDPLGYLFQTIWDRVKMVRCDSFIPSTYKLIRTYQWSPQGKTGRGIPRIIRTSFPPIDMMGSIADIAAAMQQRVRDVHRYYFDGLLRQVRDAYDQRVLTRDTQEHILNRRRTVAVYPTIVICECVTWITTPMR